MRAKSARHLTSAEAREFKKRWETVNAAELEELASTHMYQKFRQLQALMVSMRKLGWSEAMTTEEIQVRERWARLRRDYHA